MQLNLNNIELGIVNSTFKHIKYEKLPLEIWNQKSIDITVVRGEKFAFQLLIKSIEDFFCILDKNFVMSWMGIDQNRVRLNLEVEDSSMYKNLEKNFNMSFIGYVKDDLGVLVGDPILSEKNLLIEAEISQAIWIEGIIPYNFKDDTITLNIDVFFQSNYEDEIKLTTLNIPIKVLDFNLPSLDKSIFYLDLWQHPSNWARMYKVPLWSKEHFDIIENMIKELSTMGQKVITCIVSDFPWAGQTCYKYPKNASNLYEYNMVKVFKDKEGKLYCDFSSLDRYIEICMKYGINREIDFFGLLGNWEGRSFGNPMIADNYMEPIRISYFDKLDKKIKFIHTKAEFGQYLKFLFTHMIDKNWWNKVRVITDEPNNPEVILQCEKFINDSIKEYKVLYKSACHDKNFMNKYKDKLNDMSLNLRLTTESFDILKNIKEIINKEHGKLTWFVCCFPDKPNNFISSPIIENRIIPWFTYYFDLDGF